MSLSFLIPVISTFPSSQSAMIATRLEMPSIASRVWRRIFLKTLTNSESPFRGNEQDCGSFTLNSKSLQGGATILLVPLKETF